MSDEPNTIGAPDTDIATVQYGSAPGSFSWADLWKTLKVVLYGAISAGFVALAHGVAGMDFSMLNIGWHGVILVTGPQIATILANVLLYAAALLIKDSRKA